jgi:O-antigen/teichoic acid export membrane protein
MSQRLKSRVVRAAPWAAAEAVSNAISGFATVLVAGWFLNPIDIGRAGVVIGIVTLLGLLAGLGIQESLIRHRSVHTVVTDTAFTGLCVLAALGVVLCWLVAEPVGWFYGDPQLPFMLDVMSLMLVLNASMAVPVAVLTRKMRANVLTRRMMAARVSQVIVIGVLGYLGFGSWAMIVGMLFASALSVVVLWSAMPRRPRLHFDRREFRSLASFGGSISIEALLWQGTSRLFALMIGYLHGVAALGHFQFGQRLVEEAGNLIQGNIVRFGLSFFSDLERTSGDPTRVFLMATGLITAIGGPLFIGMILVASDFVPLVFGQRWAPAVPLIQVFAATWFFLLSRALVGPLLRAKGHQNALVLYGLVACLITLASGFLTAEQALVVVALGWGARNIVTLPWSYYLAGHYGGIPVRAQLLATIRPLIPMIVMAGLVLLTQAVLADAHAGLRLAASIMVGLVSSVVLVPLFNREVLQAVRSLSTRFRAGRKQA